MLTTTSLRRHIPEPGIVTWLSIRPERKAPVKVLESVQAIPGKGLEGDHYGGSGGLREVTLVLREQIDAISSFLKQDVLPESLRRNLVIEGINLTALKEMHVQIGDAVIEITGNCPPCSRMEENLGLGGYQACRGHGGFTARVVEGGLIRIGDRVVGLGACQ